MRITNLVTTIIRTTASAGAWLVRHMTQPRTTVEAWMTRRGIDVAGRKRWASAVGRKVAQVARERGVEATRERITIGAGKGWSDAFVYPADVFADLMTTAWTALDSKGKSFADKIG
jgi:hypothetical protein